MTMSGRIGVSLLILTGLGRVALGERLPLRKITVRSEQAAEAVTKRLRAGESIQLLAQSYSVDGNAWRGGYLGEVQSESLSPDLLQAAQALDPGNCGSFFRSGSDWIMLCRLPRRYRDLAADLEEEGAGLLQAGRVEEAIGKYQQSLDAYPDFVQGCFALGVAYGETGDTRREEKSYRLAIRMEPQFHLAHYNLGRLLMAQGDLPGALRSFQEAIRLRPDLPEPYVNVSALQLRLGHPEAALEAARKAVEINPLLASAHYNLGVALGGSDLQGALESFETAATIDPGYLDARLNAAIAMVKLERGDEAVRRLRALLSERPDYQPAANVLAQLGQPAPEPAASAAPEGEIQRLEASARRALGEGRADDAVRDFEAALKLDPDSAQLRERLCWTLVASGKEKQVIGRWEEALSRWDRALNLNSRFVPALAALTEAFTLEGDFSKAEVYLNRGLAVSPGDPQLAILKSRLAYERRDLETAFAVLRDLKPDSLDDPTCLKYIEQLLYLELEDEAAKVAGRRRWQPAQRFELANTYLKFSRFSDAEELLKSLPGPSGRLLLGRVYAGQLRFDEAERTFRQLIAEDQGSWPARYFLGQVYLDAGEADRAVPELLVALKLQPDNVNVLLLLGRVEAAAGRPEKALQWLDQGLRLEPNSFLLNFESGKILLDLGRLDEAQTRLFKVLEKEPDHIRAHYLLGRLFQQKGDADAARKYLNLFQELQERLQAGRVRLQAKKDALKGRMDKP